MNMEKIELFSLDFSKNYTEGLADLFSSGLIATGQSVYDLEQKLQEVYNVANCVCFDNMTTAIAQLLMNLNIGLGDTVLCHPYSCLSTTMGVLLAGAKVEWVPLNYETLCVDPKWLHDSATNAKAFLNYNVAGFVGNLHEFSKACQQRNIIFINDCNNAELSKYDGKYSVEFGDYAILSFYPNRSFGAIDGGAILSNFPLNDLQKHKRLGVDYKNYRDSDGLFVEEHDVKIISGSNNMSNISAKICLNKVINIDEIRRAKKETYSLLMDEFFDISIAPNEKSDVVPWLFPIYTNKPHEKLKKLKQLGIASTELHYPNDHYTVFRSKHHHTAVRKDLLWLPNDKRLLKFSKQLRAQ